MRLMSISVALLAGVLCGCASTTQGTPEAVSSDVPFPHDPADEARQVTANVVAYLSCACLFIEQSTPERCSADLPPGMNEIVPVVDKERRSVDVTVGRWTAHAQDRGSSQGCQLR